MNDGSQRKYDALLLKAHIVQLAVGTLFLFLNFSIFQLAEGWFQLLSLALICSGISGVFSLYLRFSVAYLLLAVFNVAQIFWVTTSSYSYGFVFGLYFNIWLDLGSAKVAVNLVAVAMLILAVVAWGDAIKRRAR